MANEDLKSSVEKLKNARSQVEQERIINDLLKAREKSIGNINITASKTKAILSAQLQNGEEELKDLKKKIDRYKVLSSISKTEFKTKEKQRKYVQSHRSSEVAEFEDIIKLTKKQQRVDKDRLRNQIKYIEQRVGVEKKAITDEIAEEQKKNRKIEAYEKKFGEGSARDIGTKIGHIKKGGGRGVGNIAGDVDDALSSISKPFKNKSLNPLKWLKGGSNAAEDMEKSSQGMAQWAQAISETKGAAGLGDEKDIQKGTADILGQAVKSAGKNKSLTRGKTGKELQKGTADILGQAVKSAGKNKSLTRGKTGKELQKGTADIIGEAAKDVGVGKGIIGKGIKGKGIIGGEGGIGPGDLGVFTKATKGLGMMVTVVKALSLALGVLSKMSWIFAIIGAVSALVSSFVELDKFLKGLNKTFLEMAGPTVGLKDIKKDMSDFNNAIFSLNRNLKLGLKPEDIQKMFQAVQGAGMPAQVMMEQAGGYEKAITMIKKTSLDLGTSFEDAGKIITKQMMDIKTSFEGSRKSLQAMGFAATKAGVTTNTFYAAIEHSVQALSFMGNYTRMASNALSTFMKEGALSFKDATKAADQYMGAFTEMDWKGLQKVAGMVGKNFSTYFQEGFSKQNKEEFGGTLAENTKKLSDLYEKLSKAKPEEKDDLGKQIQDFTEKVHQQGNRIEEFTAGIKTYQKTGVVIQLKPFIGALTSKLAQIMDDIKKQGGTQDLGTAMLVLKQFFPNIDETTITQMTAIGDDIQKNYDSLQKTFDDKMSKAIAGNGALIDNMKSLVDLGAANKHDNKLLFEIQQKFLEQGRTAGLSDTDAIKYSQDMIDMIKRSGEENESSSDDIKSVLDALKKETSNSSDDQLKLDTKAFKIEKKGIIKLISGIMTGNKQDEKDADELSKNDMDIIDSTTSAADYLDIAKESLNYLAAKGADSLGVMKTISKGVIGIGGDVALLASDKADKLAAAKEALRNVKFGQQTSTGFTVGTAGYGAGLSSTAVKTGGMTIGEAGIAKKQAEADIKKLEESKDESKEAKEKKDKLLKSIDEYNKILEEGNIALKNRLGVSDAQRAQGELINEQVNPVVPGSDAGINKKAADKAAAAKAALGSDITLKHDFKATQAGLALLDKGDVAFNPARGIAGKSGEFFNEVLSKMGLFDAPMAKGAGGSNASYQINLGGIQVNGNIEDPVVVRQAGQKLTDMVMQVIVKHERENMLAKV